MTDVRLKRLKECANSLPLTPGVYIMKDKSGAIIYIGKAKKLKSRVTQYFGTGNNHNEKVKKMVENVDKFEYILCDSEFEAFILENSLIKQHQPKYNILLKDDKGYHYIKITDEKWKRLEFSNTADGKGKYIGPYNSSTVVKQTIDEARKIFKLPDCKRSFDKRSKPCLNYHIGLCDAPCLGKITHKDYSNKIDEAVAFIKNGGFSAKDIADMKRQMENAAEALKFEEAAKIRDRLRAVTKIAERQKVISDSHYEQDVFSAVNVGETVCIECISFRNGKLCDQNHYIFEGIISKPELFNEFMEAYYINNTDIPKSVITDLEIENTEILEKWLSEKRGKKVSVTVPKIGEQRKLIDMCRNNASYNLTLYLEPKGREKATLTEIADLLGLEKLPEYIESYDISNISGTNNVAGMVVFKNTRPLKRLYRKFRIKGFAGQDDFRSMEEVIDRRLNEYEAGKDEAFKQLPDLILLDGGKGQLSAVLPVIKRHRLSVPVFGMVKDSKHKTSKIVGINGEISIKPTKRAFNFFTEVQDEVHRYTITFHKKSRTKSMLKSELTQIEGIGRKRAEMLLKSFKTVAEIESADISALKSVPGMTEKAAQAVYNYFNK